MRHSSAASGNGASLRARSSAIMAANHAIASVAARAITASRSAHARALRAFLTVIIH